MTIQLSERRIKTARMKRKLWNRVLRYCDQRVASEADKLILTAALENWKLLILNAVTSLFSACLEGGTLGIIFIAVTLLTRTEEINWNNYLLVRHVTGLGDRLNGLGEERIFLGLLLVAVVAQLLVAFSNYFNSLSVGYFSANLRGQITDRVHRQVMRFSFAHASSYKVGDLVNYIVAASDAVNQQIVQLSKLLINNCLLLAYVAVMMTISVWLLFAAVMMAGLLYFLQKHLLPRIRITATANETCKVEFSKQVIENVQGLRFLHTYAQQQTASKKVEQKLQRWLPELKQRAKLMGMLGPISQALPTVTLALLAGTAFILFQDRATGVLPSLATFVIALQRFGVRLQGVMNARNILADNSGRIQRLKVILQPQGKEFSRQQGLPFPGLKTDIELSQLGLRYQPDQPEAIKSLDLVIPKGKTTALVGTSGGGKSTLSDLLIGLYEPTAGAIRVNGRDLREFDPLTWRQHLGVVSQDTFTFNASILENIRTGRSTASDDEVIVAAKAAQADDFIQALPEGYGTVVGERGYRLSGGQRQRLALARAILRNPEILILDEATSALDTQSERLVQQALQEFGRDRTVLVIAHRLSTIVEADQIVVLKDGTIFERGTHSELLQRSGAYADYWQLQAHHETIAV